VANRFTAKIGAVPRRVAQRFGWGLADQAMSSLSNAAMSFYVARELGASRFGAFSLAYVTYSFMLTASRGLATDPMLVRFSGVNPAAWRRVTARTTGTALVVGLIAGTAALAAAAALHGGPRPAFLALGLILPGLLVQDSWRYSFFALGQGSKAFINDTVWTVGLVPLLLVLRILHQNSVFWLMMAWGGAAALAACVGPFQARVIPRPSLGWQWVVRHRDLGLRYLFENTANSGAGQLRTYGLSFIAGLAAVGYVQAAGLLMGPFQVIFLGISLVTVPEAARILRHSPRHLRLYCVLVGVGLATLGVAWGSLMLVLLPKGLGNVLLGAHLWREAYRLVLPSTVSIVGYCLIAGATAGLHALGAAKASLRAMIISSVMYLSFTLTGAYLGGAVGTVRGAALATCSGAVVWWWHLRVAMRDSDKIPARGPGRFGRRGSGPPAAVPVEVAVPALSGAAGVAGVAGAAGVAERPAPRSGDHG
jgi:O-antigen/teichoic acid export membrane protein